MTETNDFGACQAESFRRGHVHSAERKGKILALVLPVAHQNGKVALSREDRSAVVDDEPKPAQELSEGFLLIKIKLISLIIS